MFVKHTINSIAPTRRNVSSPRTSRGDLWREFGNENGLDAATWFNRKPENLQKMCQRHAVRGKV